MTDIDTLNVLGLKALKLLETPSKNEENRLFRFTTLAKTYNVLGFYNDYKGNTSGALHHYLLGIKVAESINNTAVLDELYNNIASVYLNIGAHSKSFHFYTESLLISIKLSNPENIANRLDNMSFIFQAQSDLEKTLLYRQKALDIRKNLSESSGISRSYNNVGLVHHLKGNPTLAKSFYFKSLAVNKKTNDLQAISVNYDNIGSCFAEEGLMDSAITYYNYGLDLAKTLGIPHNISSANLSLSMAYRKMKQYKAALKHANEGYALAMSLDNQNLLIHATNELSLIHEALGNHKEGLSFLRIYNTLNDTFNKSRFERDLLLKEEQLRFSLESKIAHLKMEKEITLNQSKSERKLWTFLTTAFLIITLVLFLLYNSRQKQKLTSSRLEISELKKRTLEEELTTKRHELTSISIRIIQNNQYLKSVNEIIKELKSDNLGELNQKLHKLKNSIKESSRVDEDWNNFQRQFDGVHVEFSKKLKEKYPQLTPNEIKLCRLMKLNMNSSEIAIFLNVSSNTLRSSRYRIHKKMNLEKGTKLHEFLLKMG